MRAAIHNIQMHIKIACIAGVPGIMHSFAQYKVIYDALTHNFPLVGNPLKYAKYRRLTRHMCGCFVYQTVYFTFKIENSVDLPRG